ncbi:MAG: phospho-N-acetylmuramoyl-pentapeptide-transferase [Clostridia bacterium]|nr:phospho-N-acetylmuramoyl-pentapeptide-transferase [Clostridia bacterium]
MDKYILCALSFLLSIGLTLIIESRLIPLLSSKAKQPIYEGGPSWHMKKNGTPTMGGVAFVVSIFLSLTIAAIILIQNQKAEGISILISAIFALGNSLVGVFDDLMKLHKEENAGLTPLQKLGLQLILSIIFLMARKHFLADNTVIDFAFTKIDFGLLYYPVAIFLLLGIVNFANLTDGVDGLASSVAVAMGTVFLIIGYSFSYDIPIISSAIIGGGCGFLFFNINPAKIFMGDTGSLFFGALTVSLAFSINKPLLIIPIGIVYVIEGISVILQVLIFKLTKKRLFKMAPLHHHLEKCGFSENRICVISVIVTLIFSAFSLLFLRS